MNRLALIAVILVSAGCSSISARREDGAAEFYAGVREDVEQLRTPDEDERALKRMMYVVDLPFSAILDTLLIPYDYFRRKNPGE